MQFKTKPHDAETQFVRLSLNVFLFLIYNQSKPFHITKFPEFTEILTYEIMISSFIMQLKYEFKRNYTMFFHAF